MPCQPNTNQVYLLLAGDSSGPSPADYSVTALRLSSPAFSFGGRVETTAREKTPGPGSYDVNGASSSRGIVLGTSKRGLKAGKTQKLHLVVSCDNGSSYGALTNVETRLYHQKATRTQKVSAPHMF